MANTLKIGGLRDLKFAIRGLSELVKKAENEGPGEWGTVGLYTGKDQHTGLHVEWVKLVLLAASMQLAALQRAAEPQQ